MNNKTNLYNDCGEFAKRYRDLTEKDLSVATGVSLKLHQYFKTSDMYCSDISNSAKISDPHSVPLCGDLLNENYKYDMWYDDEHDGYLQEDFASGGPLHGLDDDHYHTIDKSDATSEIKANFYKDKNGKQYGAHHVYEYPVVRNGGIDMYYVDRYSMALHNLMERSPATWGWGDQVFPSMTFFNSYHGRFAQRMHIKNINRHLTAIIRWRRAFPKSSLWYQVLPSAHCTVETSMLISG